MPGPAPKDASVRARRNKSSTASTLPAVHDVETPDLPPNRNWHPATLAWWFDVWSSPMAYAFHRSDVHGLLILAVLIDDFWCNPSKELAGEIRLQRRGFGLTPMDRRGLQWTLEPPAETQATPTKTRATPTTRRRPAKDPRGVLRSVK